MGSGGEELSSTLIVNSELVVAKEAGISTCKPTKTMRAETITLASLATLRVAELF
jgi:hypothetical protein